MKNCLFKQVSQTVPRLPTPLKPLKPLTQVMKTRQRGFTLIELLVALLISIVIAIAAVSALVISRQGFNTVDVASQLRDNARFSSALIHRLGVQAGFKDVQYAATVRYPGTNADPDPSITGFNNALVSLSGAIVTATTRPAADAGYGSDVLMLRYQSSETFPGSGISDNTMINCMGLSTAPVPTDRDDQMTSILYVNLSQGEPSLMCATINPDSAAAMPILRGVENFQVLYGVSNTGLNVAADSYLRADQMTGATAAATNANWRRVRSLRIGMVLRGAVGSAQDQVTQTFYPLGMAKESATGTAGFAMSAPDATDPGTRFTPPIDGRMRQVVTFTVHLRNAQGL